jgi:acyl carrier protein
VDRRSCGSPSRTTPWGTGLSSSAGNPATGLRFVQRWRIGAIEAPPSDTSVPNSPGFLPFRDEGGSSECWRSQLGTRALPLALTLAETPMKPENGNAWSQVFRLNSFSESRPLFKMFHVWAGFGKMSSMKYHPGRTVDAESLVKTEDRLLQWCNSRFRLPSPITAETDLLDGGYLDSLLVMALMVYIEEQFGVAIDSADISPQNLRSVRTLAALVAAQATGEGE